MWCFCVAVAVVAGCSDGSDSSSTTTASITAPTTPPTVAAPGPGGASGDAALPHPCTILTAADFAAAAVTVTGPGVDLSSQIGLATNVSAACQWTGDGTWDLLVGRGGAATAYEFDRGFFDELDHVAELAAGDAGYILDREESATPEDYDHEAGVLVGDVYFTLGTTDDDGADATEELAELVAERLSGATGG
jgi:hypothetical protein